MANPPPPYDNITGISRAAMKDNAQITLAEYDGNARPGELVVDQTNDNLYVGNISGSLTLIASGSGTETWATLGDKNNASGPARIALGTNAGTSQGVNSVAIGTSAGNSSQGANSVALGTSAGQTTQGVNAVAIGLEAGKTTQGTESVAIGEGAGKTTQGAYSVAVGLQAGQTSQGSTAVALGYNAGLTSQGISAVAIGYFAGYTNQATNSIILNATGAQLNQTTANTFTVKPVRDGGSAAGMAALGFRPTYYNPTTGEFVYASS